MRPTGDRDPRLAFCARCGGSLTTCHADVVLRDPASFHCGCEQTKFEPRMTLLPSAGFETKLKLARHPMPIRHKYAKKAKRQSNQREIAAIDKATRDHNKPHRTFLAARVSENTVDALLALKAELESNDG
jgi:hypothetical protein